MSFNYLQEKENKVCAIFFWSIKWILLPFVVILPLFIIIVLLIFSYNGIDEFNQDPYLINMGYIGSSIAGVSSLLSIVLTLVAIYYVRKTYDKDKKRNIEQDFENKFFSLINNFLNIKSNLDENKIRSTMEIVKDMNLRDSKIMFRNNNYIFSDFFRNLYLLLKFVDSNKNNISKHGLNLKFYTNLIRSYLSVELTQLLAINCYIVDDEKDSNYENYRKFIEEYNFLEHMSFLDLERNIVFPALCAFGYYRKEAFDKNIWLKSNSYLCNIYKHDSPNLIFPFVDFISKKRIYSEKSDCIYVSKNDNTKSMSFSYLANDQTDLYKSYCVSMAYDNLKKIIIDDHIYGFLNLSCDSNFYHLSLDLNYSKDYDLEKEDYSMLKISIGQFSNNEFKLIKNEPNVFRNDESNTDANESIL